MQEKEGKNNQNLPEVKSPSVLEPRGELKRKGESVEAGNAGKVYLSNGKIPKRGQRQK